MSNYTNAVAAICQITDLEELRRLGTVLRSQIKVAYDKNAQGLRFKLTRGKKIVVDGKKNKGEIMTVVEVKRTRLTARDAKGVLWTVPIGIVTLAK